MKETPHALGTSRCDWSLGPLQNGVMELEQGEHPVTDDELDAFERFVGRPLP